jgi:rod shape-determining protein MreD
MTVGAGGSGFQSNRSLDAWGWLIMPTLLCLIATVVQDIAFRFFTFSLPEVVWPLIPAFAWAVVRPAILPPILLFGMGVFVDLWTGGPMGLWPVALLAAYASVFLTRSVMAGQSALAMWVWYAAACLFAFVVADFLTMLDSLNTPNYLAVFWQFLVTAALFPLANRLIARYEDADVRFR